MSSPVPKIAPVRVVAIGASAGGIQTLRQIMLDLPLISHCCLLVVVHLHPEYRSLLPEILRRAGPWKVKAAEEGEPICAGVAYIAPPDFHLLLENNQLHLSSGHPVHMQRPSVDALFESIARDHLAGTIGVLLSGAGSDGADGVRRLKMAGASIIVQDPAEALFPSMPAHGIETGCADFVVPARQIAARISLLCSESE